MFAENTITHDLDGDGDVDIIQHPTTCQTIVIFESDVCARDIPRVFVAYLGHIRVTTENRVLDSRRVELNGSPAFADPARRMDSLAKAWTPEEELRAEALAGARLREFFAPLVSDPAANAAWQAKYGEWQAAKAEQK